MILCHQIFARNNEETLLGEFDHIGPHHTHINGVMLGPRWMDLMDLAFHRHDSSQSCLCWLLRHRPLHWRRAPNLLLTPPSTINISSYFHSAQNCPLAGQKGNILGKGWSKKANHPTRQIRQGVLGMWVVGTIYQIALISRSCTSCLSFVICF